MILWMAQGFLCGRGQKALPGESGAGACFVVFSGPGTPTEPLPGWLFPPSLGGQGEWTIEPACWEMHRGKLLGNSELVHLEE